MAMNLFSGPKAAIQRKNIISYFRIGFFFSYLRRLVYFKFRGFTKNLKSLIHVFFHILSHSDKYLAMFRSVFKMIQDLIA